MTWRDPVDQSSEPAEAEGPRSVGFVLFIVGWVVWDFSLLQLAQGFGAVVVFGKLKAWLDAYALVVRYCGALCFGWIRFRWFEVSDTELHLLVLGVVFAVAVSRAQFAHLQRRNPSSGYFVNFIASALNGMLLTLLPALLIAAVLPACYGVWIGGAATILPAVVRLTSFDDSESGLARVQSVRREVACVLGLLLLIVALNYSVFRLDGG